MARLERAVGTVISIAGMGIALFTAFCVAYYFMPNMPKSEYSTIEAVFASWMPQIVITAMMIVLSIGLIKLGSGLMKHAMPTEARAVEREELPPERGPSPPFIPTRPPEAVRPSPKPEERPAHMAFEMALREEAPPSLPRPPRPPAAPPTAEGRRAPPKPGPPAERAKPPPGEAGRPPEVRPALDEDELSRIIRILRERRRRA